jgi:hypothetical protein
VTGRCDGRLHDEDVCAGVYGDGCELLGVSGGARHCGNAAAGLDLLHALTDEVLLERCLGKALDDGGRVFLRRGYDFGDGGAGVVVAALEALEIHDRETAAVAELDREVRVDDGIECRRENGEAERVLGDAEVDVREFGVHGEVPGDDRDFVKPVGGSEFFVR